MLLKLLQILLQVLDRLLQLSAISRSVAFWATTSQNQVHRRIRCLRAFPSPVGPHRGTLKVCRVGFHPTCACDRKEDHLFLAVFRHPCKVALWLHSCLCAGLFSTFSPLSPASRSAAKHMWSSSAGAGGQGGASTNYTLRKHAHSTYI